MSSALGHTGAAFADIRSSGRGALVGYLPVGYPSVEISLRALRALTGLRRSVRWLVGREGIEPPQSKTADLQSAELTTCSTYPLGDRIAPW